MKTATRTVYVADDGREFNDENECRQYEVELTLSKSLAGNNPCWIINELGEFGVRIAGMNFFYYKWENPAINTSYAWRIINKREFGEVIRVRQYPINNPADTPAEAELHWRAQFDWQEVV